MHLYTLNLNWNYKKMYFKKLGAHYDYFCPMINKAGHIALVITAFACPISITGTNFFMTVSAILCILSGLFFTKLSFIKSHPLVIASLLFVALVILNSFWGIGGWHDTSSAIHKYLKLLYIPLLIPLCLDKRWHNSIINAFLLAAIITVFLSYFKSLTGWEFQLERHAKSPSGIFSSHIETGYFIAFATYLLAHRALTQRSHRYIRWIYILLVIAFSIQLFFINDARTGWIVYFGLALLFFTQHCGQQDPLSNTPMKISQRIFLCFRGISLGIISAIFIALLAYNFSVPFKAKVQEVKLDLQCSFNAEEKTSPCLRASFYKFSLYLIKHNAVFGLGTGSFAEAYRQAGGIPGWGDHLTTPHNDYLHILVQFGLLGLIIFLYFYFVQWRMSFSLGEERHTAQALIFSFMLASSFNSFIYGSVTGHFYVLFSSLFFANYGKKSWEYRYLK